MSQPAHQAAGGAGLPTAPQNTHPPAVQAQHAPQACSDPAALALLQQLCALSR